MLHTASEGISTTKSTFKRVVLWATLFVITGCIVFGGWCLAYIYIPAPEQDHETVTVVIPKGSSVREIASILADAKLVRNDIRFQILTRLKKKASKLQAGEFLLATGQRPGNVIDSLASAQPIQHAVTIPEGKNIKEIASIFCSENRWCDEGSFVSLAEDDAFIKSLGLEGIDKLEGYLFPETYFFTREGLDERKIITMMVNHFKKVWFTLSGRSFDLKNDKETIILASIIEKETGSSGERAKIAGVFRNRLKKGMRLQSDPTVIYGLTQYSGTITKKDLKTPHEYNTYVIRGLPPAPICNPGRKAINAALNPEKHDYLYFVSQNDGSHYFSKTLKEHNRAVYKYQRKK